MREAFYPHDIEEHSLKGDLEAEGWSLEDIDYVFQSHLHLDHAGGLHHFDGTDTPVFVHEEEVKFAYYSAKTDKGSTAYILGDFDHDLNWQVLHQDRETHFEDVEFIRLPGHTPGLTGTVIHLDDEGTIVFTGDEIYQAENYEDGTPLGAGLLWSHRKWFQSLQTLQDIECKHDAEIVYGHDPDQYEEIREGWG